MVWFQGWSGLASTLVGVAMGAVLWLCAGALGQAAAVQHAITIERIAPARSAFVVGVASVEGLVNGMEQGRFGDLLAEPEVRGFLGEFAAALREDMAESMRESGAPIELDDLAMPTGAAGLAVALDPDEFWTPTIALVADFGGRADKMRETLERVLEDGQTKGSIRWETSTLRSGVGDVELLTVRVVREEDGADAGQGDEHAMGDQFATTDEQLADALDELSIVWVGSTLVLTSDEQVLVDGLDAAGTGRGEALAGDERFVRAAGSFVGTSPAYVYVNVPELLDEFMPAEDPEMAFGPPVRRIFDLMGLASLEGVAMGLDVGAADRPLEVTMNISIPKKGGMFALMEREFGPFEPPAFVPGDVDSVTVISFDTPGLVGLINDMAQEIVGENDEAMGMVRQAMGLVQPVLESMGGTMTISERANPDADVEAGELPMSLLYGLATSDEAVVTNVVNLGLASGAMTSREFVGGTVFEPSGGGPMGEVPLALGVGSGSVLIGTSEAVEAGMRQASVGRAGSLAESAEFAAALAYLPERASAFAYSGPMSIESAEAALSVLRAQIVNEEAGEADRFAGGDEEGMGEDGWMDALDPAERARMERSRARWTKVGKALPSAATIARHFGASCGFVRSTAGGFEGRSLWLPPGR